MTRVVLFVLMLTVAAGAQQKAAPKGRKAPTAAAPAATRWPVETLAVEGNRRYADRQILAVAGLKIGQMAGKEEFEAARQRLMDTGFFETVGYRFAPSPGHTGYAASFQVVEVETVYPVRFEELGLPDAEIVAWLKAHDAMFSNEIPGTAPVLDRYARQIEALLASRKREEKVVGKVTATAPEKLAVLFRPARPSPVVAQVSFTGNQVVPPQALQEAIGPVAIGTPYSEERFRQLLDSSVRPLYDARGRIRVAFPKVTAEPVQDVQGLHVKVAVEEGPSFDLGGVRVDGASAFKAEEMVKAAKIKTGDIANFDDVNQGAERVRKLLQRNGYIRAQTSVERRIDDAKKTVDVLIKVDEGPRFTFGKLDIKGLDLHGEAAIRKMWGMKPGKPFDADYADRFLTRVREEGVFDNLNKTRFTSNVNEADHTVDVTLYFNQ